MGKVPPRRDERYIQAARIVPADVTIDRQRKLAEFVDAFDGYMALLKTVQQRLESSGKDSRSFYPFVERDENQRLTAFRLAVAEVFGPE